MNKLKEKFKSIRVKLFLSLSSTILIIILILVLLNSAVLSTIYTQSKVNTVKKIYQQINSYYANPDENVNIEDSLKLLAAKNNLEILVKNDENITIISTNKDALDAMGKFDFSREFNMKSNRSETIYTSDNVAIKKTSGEKSNLNYISLMANLDNGYELYIRTPMAAIQESVDISNKVLFIIGGISIILSAVLASYVSKRFTKPILELNNIAQKMSDLDFSQKYRIDDSEDEINSLGKSINTMSDKLEETINKLRKHNMELEKGIEEKSKIDEMRKQFISDVSHELKTPIALIQGYAEGLVEDVNSQPESRKYYSEVILDESNKMDKLVKQLLELMKLEYGNREFHDEKFDIISLINKVIKKCKVMIDSENIDLNFKYKKPIYVVADEFYIEQVITNYITNAIKYSTKINGKRIIEINIKEKKGNVRISIFNTCKNLQTEDLQRIWKRFYKVDESRNREQGGSGIGLAFVKAIMSNYKQDYGVENKENGIEFYFECKTC